MGLFDGRSYSTSDVHLRPSHSHTSHSRGISPARSTRSSKSQGYYVRPSAPRSTSGSFFGGGNNHRSSSSSWFGGGGGTRSIFGGGGGGSSYYRRRPRDGYISYLMHKLQRMVKDLWYYARRHPVKAFFAVVVPLLSAGGAIGGLLKQFGIRMPMGMNVGGGGYYGSRGYGGGGGGGGGWMDQAGGLMQIAKAFM